MASLKQQILKCKHPNSRKTIALTKQINKSNHKNKQKLGQYVKQNLIGEKILWFRDNLEEDVTVCTPKIVDELIQKYLRRFDEELEQITLKHSIGGRKNRQHANREDIIKMTLKREEEEYNTCGIEIPDLLNNQNFEFIKKWNGELRFLQNIKLKRIGKKHLPKNNRGNAQNNKNNVKDNNNSVSKTGDSVQNDSLREDNVMVSENVGRKKIVDNNVTEHLSEMDVD